METMKYLNYKMTKSISSDGPVQYASLQQTSQCFISRVSVKTVSKIASIPWKEIKTGSPTSKAKEHQ